MTSPSHRPKVLLIGPVPPPVFGVAQATKLMLESSVLNERFDLTHLDTSDATGFATMGRLDFHNILLALRHLGLLGRLLHKHTPDLMLLTASQGKFALLRDVLFVSTARLSRTRVVVYLRGSGYADLRAQEGWMAARLLRSVLRRSSRVIVLSKNLVPMARSVYPPARLAVVPNGCPSAVPPTRSGVRDEAHPLVAYIGRLSREKGLEDALAAAATVANAVPTVQFVFCGEWDSPSYETHIRSTVEQSGLAAAARFPGPVTADDKTELLSRAWALWVPSHSEGQPWVILEAMSAGLPVVATDTGAIPETVADGESGFVVPVGDSDGLAARIVALLEDHDLWKKLARRSLERYQAEFTVSRSHAALADVLARVIRDDSGAAT